MKRLLVFFFLILPSISNSHPLGQGENNLDNNFKCVGINDLGKEINFGFKDYNYKNEGAKFLLSVPFNKESQKYTAPASAVYEFGTYTINNIVYDNMQMWFDHGYSGSNIYVFRRSLVEKKNTYLLNESMFVSTPLMQKRLNKLKKKLLINLAQITIRLLI